MMKSTAAVASVARFWVLLIVVSGMALPDLTHADPPGQAHRESVLRSIARDSLRTFQSIFARMESGDGNTLAEDQLDSLLSDPVGDIFWMYPATAFYHYGQKYVTPAIERRFRRAWKEYTPYRGDTENHFLMYYSSLLLMSQAWPDLAGSEWFNGKSSAENYRESLEFLHHWIDDVSRHGLTEWDSPRYLYYYLTPLLALYDHSQDMRLRQRVELTLEILLAEYSLDYLAGYYVGAHSRDGDRSVLDQDLAEINSYGAFFFEDSVSMVLPDLAFAVMSEYEPPPYIYWLAHQPDRLQYDVRKTRRSRRKIRYSDSTYTLTERRTRLHPMYALGSIEGGLQQPIQQHTWDLTLLDESGNDVTIFSIDPYWSAMELGMFFPEEPELMVAGILNSKASYTSPLKWIGGSPHEMIEQRGNRLTARYDFPDSVPGSERRVYLRVPESSRTESPALRAGRLNGVGYSISLDAADIRSAREGDGYERVTLAGDTVVIAVSVEPADELPLLPGHLPQAQVWIDSPWVWSEYGSGLFTIEVGDLRRTLDFNSGEVSESELEK